MKTTTKVKPNAWKLHVKKELMKPKNKGLPLKKVLKLASASYKK